jgi:hypothetical protein
MTILAALHERFPSSGVHGAIFLFIFSSSKLPGTRRTSRALLITKMA